MKINFYTRNIAVNHVLRYHQFFINQNIYVDTTICCKNNINYQSHGYLTTIDWINSIQEFTNEQQTIIHLLIQKLFQSLWNWNYFFRYIDWNFMLTDSNIEHGLPYTINDTIVLSMKLLQNSSNTIQLANILIHERIHILQKCSTLKFEQLYQNYWHWVKISTKTNNGSCNNNNNQSLFNRITCLYRNNPDIQITNTNTDYWIWNNELFILNTFQTTIDNDRNIYYIYPSLQLISNNHPIVLKFFHFYGISHNQQLQNSYYHPYEISAEMITQLCMIELTNNHTFNTSSIACARLNQWFATHS